jgi:diguanylate cyclase (GGDEF)-like protein/PAS domain S-box-containing protein
VTTARLSSAAGVVAVLVASSVAPAQQASVPTAPAAPAAAPATAPTPRTIAQALRTLDSGDSVRVAGRATVGSGVLQRRVFDVAIEDGTAGVRLFTRQSPVVVAPGDSVEATGVVRGYRGTLELVLGTVRVVPGPRRLLEPVDPAGRPVSERDGGRLVRVRGRVLALGTSEGGRWARLWREAAGDTVTLWAPAPHAAPPDVDGLRVGDELTVTGIVAAYQDGSDQPVVWQLIPRSPDDVVAEGVPHRWYERARLALGGLVVGGALLWGLVRAATRRHVRERHETEARYQQLLELSPEAVFVHDGRTVLFANPAAARLLGASHESTLAGQPLSGFASPERVDAFGQPGRPGSRARIRLSVGATAADVEVAASPCRYNDRAAVVVMARDVSAQLRHERELQALALLDELTGLPNRRGFSAFAEQELLRAREAGRGAVLLVVDLVGLKRINDEHGHPAGDEAIRTVARALRALGGDAGVLARWGGDEFVGLFFDGDDAAAARALVARLAELVRAQSPAGLPYEIRASAGAAPLAPDGSDTVADAIARADADLYRMRAASGGAAVTAGRAR